MASARPLQLPDFKNPPVTEVALSIQFNSLVKFGSIHSGILWQLFREGYPQVVEQPPLPPTFETFGDTAPAAFAPTLQLLSAFPMPRYWFVTMDETRLVQIQQDRVIYNWRQMKAADAYPRYEFLREKFGEALKTVESFLKEGQLGELKPTQCEVTYVNFIQLGDGVDARQVVEEITPLWAGKFSGKTDLKVEDLNLNLKFVLRDAEKKPEGRLYVTIQGAVRNRDRATGVQLQLVARGRPKQESIASAFEWLDRGRAAIVENFALITKPAMHRQWERTNASK